MNFPIRINKYLAEKNVATRRGADKLITAGKIKINGRVARLGDKISAKDIVTIVGEEKLKEYKYFTYNKPQGIVTNSPQPGEKEIRDVTSLPKGVFPIGRLDKDSEGLIILTSDGRVTDRLLNPKFSHEKEYVVSVNKPITNTFLLKIKEGLKTAGFQARPAKIRKTGPQKFEIILTEGKNRQIRRMTAALGFSVRELKRVRIGNIRLGNLKSGQMRPIEGRELETFLEEIKLN